MPRVLLADDDDAVRNMLQVTLERDGFEVVAVASVSEALSRIATQTFDVLVSDLHMPHAGDGFTVVSPEHQRVTPGNHMMATFANKGPTLYFRLEEHFLRSLYATDQTVPLL